MWDVVWDNDGAGRTDGGVVELDDGTNGGGGNWGGEGCGGNGAGGAEGGGGGGGGGVYGGGVCLLWIWILGFIGLSFQATLESSFNVSLL